MNRYQRNVRRGAAYLDERYGTNWTDKIDLPRLDIDSNWYCILAQLSPLAPFGEFRLSSEAWTRSGFWLRRHGFIVLGSGLFLGLLVGYRDSRRFTRRTMRLQQAWRDHIIAARLHTQRNADAHAC